jgi:hypothetical protein
MDEVRKSMDKNVSNTEIILKILKKKAKWKCWE